jgi:hypothetical protein
VAIGYSGYVRGPAILRDSCFNGMHITPGVILQYAKSRLTAGRDIARGTFRRANTALIGKNYVVSRGKGGQYRFMLYNSIFYNSDRFISSRRNNYEQGD